MIKNLYKLPLMVVVASLAVTIALDWHPLALSIFFGCGLALFNFGGLSWGLQKFFQRDGGRVLLAIFSLLRLFIVFSLVVVLLYNKLASLTGLVIGFTIVFVVVLVEGLLKSGK